MQAKDVMTHPVISVSTPELDFGSSAADAPTQDQRTTCVRRIREAWLVSLAKAISCVGSETDTLRRRPRWIEFFVGPGKLADEYVHASTRKVSEVMTSEVHTVSENAPLDESSRLWSKIVLSAYL